MVSIELDFWFLIKYCLYKFIYIQKSHDFLLKIQVRKFLNSYIREDLIEPTLNKRSHENF